MQVFPGVASALEIFDKRLDLILDGRVEKTMPNSQRQQVLQQNKGKTNTAGFIFRNVTQTAGC